MAEKIFCYAFSVFFVVWIVGWVSVYFNQAKVKKENFISRVELLEYQVKKMLPREVIVTAYSSEENQTDSTPYETAFLKKTKPWIIAISRDLVAAGWLPGDRVYLYRIEKGKFKGLGVFLIADLMHDRKRNQFDIWVNSRAFAEKIGRMKNVKAILLKI